MTGALWAGGDEQARWQRQAAGELARILEAHPRLPALAWTVGPAGCVLAGRVSGLAAAGQAREVFGAWGAALALTERQEHLLAGGTAWLHAAARRGPVKVRLAAAMFTGEEDGL